MPIPEQKTVSPSAAARIASHLDDELQWIVGETSAAVFARSERVTRGKLCEEIARAVGHVLIEREGADVRQLDIAEFEKLGRQAVVGVPESARTSDDVALHVAELCVVYMQSRRMGMHSIVPARSNEYHDSYNPFANEGGFCNPMKLKMMDD